MPRIFADNEAHEIQSNPGIKFKQGVGVAPLGTDTSYFTAEYIIDSAKHDRTLFDDLSSEQLRQLCDYLDLAYDQGATADTKYTVTKAIEESLSTKYIAAVTVASAAGDKLGDTKITITGAGTYKYKTAATTAPAVLFKDDVTDWDDIETLDQFAPIETHDKITVVRVNSDNLVIGKGTATITVKNS